MTWHIVPIQHECADEHCPRNATHEVRNEQNEPIGRFCRTHAQSRVDAHNRGEPSPTSPSPSWADRR